MLWITSKNKSELKHCKRKVGLDSKVSTMRLHKATLTKMKLKSHLMILIHLLHKHSKLRNRLNHPRFTFHLLIVRVLHPKLNWVLADHLIKFYPLLQSNNKMSAQLDNAEQWLRHNNKPIIRASSSSLRKFRTKGDLQLKSHPPNKTTFMISLQDTKCK